MIVKILAVMGVGVCSGGIVRGIVTSRIVMVVVIVVFLVVEVL